jgi:hypothetical protein
MDENKPTGEGLPLHTRVASVTTADPEKRTVSMTWSTGSEVMRYDWRRGVYYKEVLSLDPQHVRLQRLNGGGAPLLPNHWAYDIRSVLGVMESATVDGATGEGIARFSKRADVEGVWMDVQDNILRSVSVGYIIHKVERQAPENESDPWVYRVIDWEPIEVSIVPIPADPNAGFRGLSPDGKHELRTFPCVFTDAAPAAPLPKDERMDPKTVNQNEAGAGNPTAVDQEAIRKQAAEAERQRASDIRAAVRKAKLPEDFADDLVARNVSIEAARAAVIDKIAEEAERSAPTRSGAHITTEVDEREVKREAMAAAIAHRLQPTGTLPDAAREYRHMSLIRLAEESLVIQGERVRGLSAREIAERALHTTSDFPNILANVMNKRLRAGYQENVPTYTAWARRAPNAPDFKSLSVTQLSATPDLLRVNEAGEFKYGTMSDGRETYAVLTFGRIIGVSRQTLINDDMRALDRVATGFGASARRLENRTVYAQLTSNPTMGDGVALFHSSRGNLAASGAAISQTTLSAMRAAMRVQKGLQGEELNLSPAFLIVPASQEQLAYQFTSSQFVPAKPSDVNEFRTGGRTALEPIVDAVLDSASTTVWYAAANSADVDTVEYCYLDGSEGVYLESRIGFNVDGMEIKARLDFAAKAIDGRGLYRNPGA